MRKELQILLIIVTCAVLGLITANIIYILYTQNIVVNELLTGSITINSLMFLVFFVWLIVGIVIGVMKD